MWASAAGHDAVVAFLLDRVGDEQRHHNRDGSASSCRFHYRPSESPARINAIMCAAMGGYAAVVARLLDGCDRSLVDAQDANGNSALHLAVRGHHVACVRVLLAHGPDLHRTDRKALSVLDLIRLPDA